MSKDKHYARNTESGYKNHLEGLHDFRNNYSETTSTEATQGLSANQKPILKQRNERADLTGNCHIFLIGYFRS